MAEATGAVSGTSADSLYAGFWLRVGAALIDWILLAGTQLAILFVIGFAIISIDADAMTEMIDDGTFDRASTILGILIAWMYHAGMESSSFQGSLGKLAVRIKVTDDGGERISFGRATGRHFGKIVSAVTLGVGFLMAAFTARRQTLHDMMAGCLVKRR